MDNTGAWQAEIKRKRGSVIRTAGRIAGEQQKEKLYSVKRVRRDMI